MSQGRAGDLTAVEAAVGAVADLAQSLPPSARLQTRPIIALAGRLVLVEMSRFEAVGEQRILL